MTKKSLEALGFKFQKIGYNDFQLLGSFQDKNGIVVNWYDDNTFGVPYGEEGNVMDLKSIQDLILLRGLLTGELSTEREEITALRQAVGKKINSDTQHTSATQQQPNSSTEVGDKKKHRFPKQESPMFDIVMQKLYDRFQGYSLDVHDAIVDVMDKHQIPLEDNKIRGILAEMAIELTNKMNRYEF